MASPDRPLRDEQPRVLNIKDKRKGKLPRGVPMVYIGRGTPYGNPFIAGTHGSRERVIERFVEEVLPDLDVSELRGKSLLCHCAPLPCHGDALLEKANALPDGLWWSGGKVMFECTSCGEATEWFADIEDFDIDNDHNQCGRSRHCCP